MVDYLGNFGQPISGIDKQLSVLWVVLCIVEASAQDTVYYKIPGGNSLSDYGTASYRVQTADSLGFKIMEYSSEGELLVEGHSSSRDTLSCEGLFRYYRDSTLVSEGNFRNNRRVGEWKEFYSEGNPHRVWNYNDEGGYHGMFNVYYPDGSVRRSDRYKNDKLKEGKCYTASGADTSWFSYEIRPEFPGGEQKRIEYFTKKIVYPKAAREAGIQGVVYASFVVEKDGSIGEVKILRGVHPLLNVETIRVISDMPRWKPGLIDGSPVRVKYNMPMSFKLTK